MGIDLGHKARHVFWRDHSDCGRLRMEGLWAWRLPKTVAEHQAKWEEGCYHGIRFRGHVSKVRGHGLYKR